MDSLEERLARIEELLMQVLRLLQEVNESMKSFSDEAALAVSIALGLSKPVIEALEAARRVAPIIERLQPDEITRSILEALADCKPLSISEVYRRVKQLRGRASRSTVASRLRNLEEKGVVINLGSEQRPRYTLTNCIEE